MVYLSFMVTFAQRYQKNAGIDTIRALMLPYSVIMLIVWTIFFILWFILGIPFGPGMGPAWRRRCSPPQPSLAVCQFCRLQTYRATSPRLRQLLDRLPWSPWMHLTYARDREIFIPAWAASRFGLSWQLSASARTGNFML
jgi:hypothetical protein